MSMKSVEADHESAEPAKVPVATAARRGPRTSGVLATGGVLGAIAASSCCIVPLALFSLGATGAWIGRLTALAPYQPIFTVLTLGLLAGGFWTVYRRPKARCADGSDCPRPMPRRIVKTALWGATVLVAAAMAFPYVAPMLLDV